MYRSLQNEKGENGMFIPETINKAGFTESKYKEEADIVTGNKDVNSTINGSENIPRLVPIINSPEYPAITAAIRAALRNVTQDNAPKFPTGASQDDILCALMDLDSCWPYLITSWPIPRTEPYDLVQRFLVNLYYEAYVDGNWLARKLIVSVRNDTRVWMITQMLASYGMWVRVYDWRSNVVWGIERCATEGEIRLYKNHGAESVSELSKERTLGEQLIVDNDYIWLDDRMSMLAFTR